MSKPSATPDSQTHGRTIVSLLYSIKAANYNVLTKGITFRDFAYNYEADMPCLNVDLYR